MQETFINDKKNKLTSSQQYHQYYMQRDHSKNEASDLNRDFNEQMMQGYF